MEIEMKCVAEEGASLPEYQTDGAAGADVRAFLPGGAVVVPPMSRAVVPTGVRLCIPEGFEVQVRPRSGLAARHGVTVLNAPGTIDSDYRGEVKVILANFGDGPFRVEDGDRIAQLVVAPVVRGSFVRASSLPGTERGAGGFGSTGRA